MRSDVQEHGERLAYRMGEAAEILGVSKVTLWRLIRAGRLHPVEVTDSRRPLRLIPAHELHRLLGAGQ